MEETMAEAVWRLVNGWPGAPGVFGLDGMEKGPGRMVQQLSGTMVERSFVDGGFIGNWPFAVVVRVDGTDTRARLEAVGMLGALARWLAGVEMVELGEGREWMGATMTGLPAQVAAYADGMEDYQAGFLVRYRGKG